MFTGCLKFTCHACFENGRNHEFFVQNGLAQNEIYNEMKVVLENAASSKTIIVRMWALIIYVGNNSLNVILQALKMLSLIHI